MGGVPIIIRLAHEFFACNSIEACEQALARLCEIDIRLAGRLADVMNAAIPSSAPVWAAILEHAQDDEVDRPSGPPLTEGDAVDTARGLMQEMGWRDMEPSA